jgi:hypothetical protein
MKIFQAVQKLLVGDTQTDWLFDKFTFTFGVICKILKISLRNHNGLHIYSLKIGIHFTGRVVCITILNGMNIFG